MSERSFKSTQMSAEMLSLSSCHCIFVFFLCNHPSLLFFAILGVPFVHVPSSLPSSKLRSIPKLTRRRSFCLLQTVQTEILQVRAKEAFDKVEKAAAAVEARCADIGHGSHPITGSEYDNFNVTLLEWCSGLRESSPSGCMVTAIFRLVIIIYDSARNMIFQTTIDRNNWRWLSEFDPQTAVLQQGIGFHGDKTHDLTIQKQWG